MNQTLHEYRTKLTTIPLLADRVEPAARILARAFDSEPLRTCVLAGALGNARNLNTVFEFTLRYALRFGQVQATSERLEGIAIWLPDRVADYPLPDVLWSGGLAAAWRMGLQATARIEAMGRAFNKLRHRLASFPHEYLAALGVDPLHQHKGYARALLGPMLGRLDLQRKYCYLETMNENNVGLYRKFGFELVEQTRIPELDIGVWCMLRSPARSRLIPRRQPVAEPAFRFSVA